MRTKEELEEIAIYRQDLTAFVKRTIFANRAKDPKFEDIVAEYVASLIRNELQAKALKERPLCLKGVPQRPDCLCNPTLNKIKKQAKAVIKQAKKKHMNFNDNVLTGACSKTLYPISESLVLLPPPQQEQQQHNNNNDATTPATPILGFSSSSSSSFGSMALGSDECAWRNTKGRPKLNNLITHYGPCQRRYQRIGLAPKCLWPKAQNRRQLGSSSASASASVALLATPRVSIPKKTANIIIIHKNKNKAETKFWKVVKKSMLMDELYDAGEAYKACVDANAQTLHATKTMLKFITTTTTTSTSSSATNDVVLQDKIDQMYTAYKAERAAAAAVKS